MKTYYWETKDNNGAFEADDDTQAREKLQNLRSQWRYGNTKICYRESDTPDGIPFFIIEEEKIIQNN